MRTINLFRHELKGAVTSMPMLVVVLLPVVISKVIGTATNFSGADFLMLAMWIVFAQVMVGIMLAGPNLIEEREQRTLDALLITPLKFGHILVGKGLATLTLSLASALMVFGLNQGLDPLALRLFPVMVAAGVIFIGIGFLIGLLVRTSRTGSALSSAVMIGLFLVLAVYQNVPNWTYSFLVLLPSIEVAEIMKALFAGHRPPLLETALLIGWFPVLGGAIALIGRRDY